MLNDGISIWSIVAVNLHFVFTVYGTIFASGTNDNGTLNYAVLKLIDIKHAMQRG